MSSKAINKAETKRDPFADEIALRLHERRVRRDLPKDPWKMTLAEIIRELDRCAARLAGLVSHG